MILFRLPGRSIKNFSAFVFSTVLFLNQVSCKNETITEDDTAEQTFHSRDSSDSSGVNISEKLSFLRLNPDSLDIQNFSLYPKEIGENTIAEIHIPHQNMDYVEYLSCLESNPDQCAGGVVPYTYEHIVDLPEGNNLFRIRGCVFEDRNLKQGQSCGPWSEPRAYFQGPVINQDLHQLLIASKEVQKELFDLGYDFFDTLTHFENNLTSCQMTPSYGPTNDDKVLAYKLLGPHLLSSLFTGPEDPVLAILDPSADSLGLQLTGEGLGDSPADFGKSGSQYAGSAERHYFRVFSTGRPVLETYGGRLGQDPVVSRFSRSGASRATGFDQELFGGNRLFTNYYFEADSSKQMRNLVTFDQGDGGRFFSNGEKFKSTEAALHSRKAWYANQSLFKQNAAPDLFSQPGARQFFIDPTGSGPGSKIQSPELKSLIAAHQAGRPVSIQQMFAVAGPEDAFQLDKLLRSHSSYRAGYQNLLAPGSAWHQDKIEIMKLANRNKFQNSPMKEALLATWGADIQEKIPMNVRLNDWAVSTLYAQDLVTDSPLKSDANKNGLSNLDQLFGGSTMTDRAKNPIAQGALSAGSHDVYFTRNPVTGAPIGYSMKGTVDVDASGHIKSISIGQNLQGKILTDIRQEQFNRLSVSEQTRLNQKAMKMRSYSKGSYFVDVADQSLQAKRVSYGSTPASPATPSKTKTNPVANVSSQPTGTQATKAKSASAPGNKSSWGKPALIGGGILAFGGIAAFTFLGGSDMLLTSGCQDAARNTFKIETEILKSRAMFLLSNQHKLDEAIAPYIWHQQTLSNTLSSNP